MPAGLAQLLERECLARALDMLIVSATTGQQRLDLHFGVEALGRLVGREGAWYQPMRRRRERFNELLPTAAWRRR